jgi:hypothetical protein
MRRPVALLRPIRLRSNKKQAGLSANKRRPVQAPFLFTENPGEPALFVDAVSLREPESKSLENALIQRRIAWAIAARFVFHENFRDLRMPDRLTRLVRQQILLGHVGDIFRF